ncbi:branched-chain amino acid ABC transporter permease [Enterovirga rhinocerotis]|uniref:Amino acid/amide ABC transporter membrane protein 2 (HAAT family) n=1 Tax=Enterovirga rhinocerotis TaxID=1339210 RepID=A0A4R7C4F3_9HYPH|nr:branched-chain amino acid ABC transporter permease [Enterovirga rhinocerotis]TDR92893.1 amino acid/amide ABC transporter membrane protein 2 (HAAT family) [Enterovirga rhinocerotis]
MRRSALLLALAAAVIALIPVVAPNLFYVHLAIVTCLNVMFVLGLAVIARVGQLSMGHAGFGLLGGYVSALLAMNLGLPVPLGLLAATLAAAATAALLGWIILRLRGVYFVLVAFSFGQIVVLLALGMEDITQGANGLVNVPAPAVFGYLLNTKTAFYPLAVAAAALVGTGVWLLFRSPFGDAMAAIAENPRLTESSGVDTHVYQVVAFSIGSGIAGFAGALSTHYFQFISPDSFTFWDSVSYLTMLVVGGRVGVWGPILGAVVLTPLPELLRSTQGLQHVLYGAVLILVLLFLRDGLVGLPARLRGLRRTSAPHPILEHSPERPS